MKKQTNWKDHLTFLNTVFQKIKTREKKEKKKKGKKNEAIALFLSFLWGVREQNKDEKKRNKNKKQKAKRSYPQSTKTEPNNQRLKACLRNERVLPPFDNPAHLIRKYYDKKGACYGY